MDGYSSMEEGEWGEMSEVDKWNMVNKWADNYIEIYYEEKE